ncbi:MAG TPA: S-adenosylmethionine synthetase N-terminal domain-containing protein [Verrucomicrobiae bacterium]|nr:S-adenosylmethionine synthetase N-terminal domain-containing protein [Verrucomicrobiae bacterium]
MAFAMSRGSGHPDTACDHVAESLAAEFLRRDPAARCDIRVMGGHGVLFVSGHVKSEADFDAGAIVRKACGEIDPLLALEPFVSLERPDGMPLAGSPSPVSVFGYASSETPERLPPAVAFARRGRDELERLRREDPDWYWCGSDFEVSVHGTHGLARVSHVPSIALEDVRMRVASALARVLPDLDWKVNPAGPETRGGLAGAIGSSRLPVPGGAYGSSLPDTSWSAGLHPRHPAKAGSRLAREVAVDLVDRGLGKAIWIELVYGPDEIFPAFMRIRNERGQDLSASLDPSRFSL